MVLARYQGTVQDSSGDTVASASIAIYSETTGGLAVIYSDRAGVVSITNPMTADNEGFFGFYVTGDAYRIVASSGATSREFRYVGIGTASEEDKELVTVAESTFSGSSNIIFNGLDNYSRVEIQIDRMIPGTDTDDLQALLSVNDAVSFIGGTSNLYTLNKSTNATDTRVGSTGAAALIMGESLGSGTGEFYKSIITMYNHSDASIYQSVEAKGTMYDSAAALRVADMNGVVITAGPITDLALQMSSGTMSGKVVYKGVPI